MKVAVPLTVSVVGGVADRLVSGGFGVDRVMSRVGWLSRGWLGVASPPGWATGQFAVLGVVGMVSRVGGWL